MQNLKLEVHLLKFGNEPWYTSKQENLEEKNENPMDDCLWDDELQLLHSGKQIALIYKAN